MLRIEFMKVAQIGHRHWVAVVVDDEFSRVLPLAQRAPEFVMEL